MLTSAQLLQAEHTLVEEGAIEPTASHYCLNRYTITLSVLLMKVKEVTWGGEGRGGELATIFVQPGGREW